jgi:hypothetical protein
MEKLTPKQKDVLINVSKWKNALPGEIGRRVYYADGKVAWALAKRGLLREIAKNVYAATDAGLELVAKISESEAQA